MFGLTSLLLNVCTCCRIEYAPEKPEWQQEKHRFYVELPGMHVRLHSHTWQEVVELLNNSYSLIEALSYMQTPSCL